jgi:hypothetical protein
LGCTSMIRLGCHGAQGRMLAFLLNHFCQTVGVTLPDECAAEQR